MNSQPPTRLPRAFISVSRCPLCAYSLKDLGENLPCPECGAEIDRDLLNSSEMHDAVVATRTWCTMGIIGWLLIAFGHWAYNMVLFAVMNGYYPGTYGAIHHAAVWLSAGAVIAPIALCGSWHRHARRNIYRIASERSSLAVKTPKRVVAVSLPGIVLGVFGCLWIIALIGAA